MRIFDPKALKRFDLYDLHALDSVQRLTLLPFDEEYQLACPREGRPETVTYMGVTSWGDAIHIHIKLRPLTDKAGSSAHLMNARVEFVIRSKDPEIGTLRGFEEETIQLKRIKDCRGNVTKYRIGGFLFEQQRPFTTTRIVFRGFLTGSDHRKKFVRIHMFSSCIGKVFDNTANFDQAFMKKQFKGKPIECEDSFEQWIQFRGTLQLEDSSTTKDLFFWGLNRKSFETHESLSMSHLMLWNHKGMGVHLESTSGILYGHVNVGMNLNSPLEEMPGGFDVRCLEDVKSLQKSEFTINLKKDVKTYKVEIPTEESFVKLSNGLWAFPLKLKDYDAYGFYWKEDFRFESFASKTVNLLEPLLPVSNDLVVSLKDENAKIEQLTGGKGSSLAILSKLSMKASNSFKVPEAVIVTSEAYKAFLEQSSDLKVKVDRFSSTIAKCKGDQQKIKAACEEIQETIRENDIPEGLKRVLEQKMIEVFGEDFGETKFAVRSSAVGEDSEEMSAAGQMTTFLGVSGIEAICQSVIACWASQFSQTAVEYKRGYGQQIDSPMGVVVQEMVSSQVAGVMFTCSPLDGNQRLVSISASYGLGESVVSGQVEPDTYTVEVDIEPEVPTVLRIREVTVGSKKHAIHMDSNLTKTQDVSEGERSTQCLTDEQVLELARIGLEVHRHYGNSRDIEFGLIDGQWNLLQSRPVTNLESLNEWEAIHELDTGHLSENEVFSRANVGEVFPGASSYMAYNLMMRMWNVTTFEFTSKLGGLDPSHFNPYFILNFGTCSNVVFVPMKTPLGLMGRKTPTDDNGFIRGIEYGFSGHRSTDLDRIEDIFEKIPPLPSGMKGLKILKFFLKQVSVSHENNIKAYEQFGDYKIDIGDDFSPAEIFKVFEREVVKCQLPYLNHMKVTNTSMLYNAILNAFLESKVDSDDEQVVLKLFSKITSSVSDVFSAQVPARLKLIASTIEDHEHFLSLSEEDSVKYLKDKNPEFCKFLKEYGHRGYKEFDPYCPQWEENSFPLIHSLKSMLTADKGEGITRIDENSNGIHSLDDMNNEQEDVEANGKLDRKSSSKKKKKDKKPEVKNILEEYDLGRMSKAFLNKFLIPRVHRGIRDRELGKNLIIRSNHQFRKLFNRLGEKLVEEGRLPNKDLLFFMTTPEIEELVNFTPTNPLTIMNAKIRLRVHTTKDAYKWDEITTGYNLVPRNLRAKVSVPIGTKKLTGVPISSGRIVARCCVAETLEDAKNIQKGDILVTYSTDIGWSPYFAALGGLVTEIGGLVSHGAVIAREYGLPCLVGVEDATAHFKTGEMLLLDSSSGFIAKVETETQL